MKSRTKPPHESTRLKNTARLIASMKPYHIEMVITIVVTFLKHATTISAAGIAAYMVSLSMRGALQPRFNTLFALLCISIVLKALMYYGEMWFGHDVAYQVLKDFRISLYDKIEAIAPAYLLENHSGNIGTALMADVELLEWFLAHTFGSAIASFFISLVILAALCAIHPAIAGVMLPFAVLTAATPFIFQKKADMQGREAREKLSRAAAVTIEGIHGLRDLLTLNFLDRYKERNRAAMRGLYDAQIAYGKRQGTETMLMTIVAGSFTVVIMALAAYFASAQRIDVVFYPVVVLLSALLFSPITEVCGVARNLGLVFAAADRIQKVFDADTPIKDAPQDSGPMNGPVQGTIQFSNVSFRYAKDLDNALENMSWMAEAGKITALTGHSGAGKSTCIHLLLRYHDVDAGRISIDGIDIRSISLEKLHDMTCAVLQDVYLFNVSIRENIRLGNPNATDEEVAEAAKKAYADEFISGLPDGYDTVTGERGFRLSGGQRQRVAIARAILKNAPILLLDEAVSNLDAESERYIRKALREQLANRTILLVAHRPSTIVSADKVVMIHKGRAVKTGTYEELAAWEGNYKKLIQEQ
jgi:ABC-type multidrug transport system fused ATPase/permease subunit